MVLTKSIKKKSKIAVGKISLSSTYTCTKGILWNVLDNLKWRYVNHTTPALTNKTWATIAQSV